jgi:curved DNA-binding protein CbpA
MSDKQMSYYEILAVDTDASFSEIKNAYRIQLKKWHPDINKSPDALEYTRKIIEAWQILGDPNKRAEYDALLAKEEFYESPPAWYGAVRQRAAKKAKSPLSVLLKMMIVEGPLSHKIIGCFYLVLAIIVLLITIYLGFRALITVLL